jgi:preprotein translocase SecE subunit
MSEKKSGEGFIIVRGVRAVIQFLGEVKAELIKVAWPTRAETIASTWVVLFAVVVSSLWIFLSDQVSSLVITGLIRLIH